MLLDTPQQRHQESFSRGYALRDFLGKYAKDFPCDLGALRWCSLEVERVMYRSGGKYFPQFENQGINPVEEYHKILHKHKSLLPTL